MATIYKDVKSGKWRIQLILNGKRLSATRDTRRECAEWEREQYLLKDKKTSKMPFEDLLLIYADKVSSQKKVNIGNAFELTDSSKNTRH